MMLALRPYQTEAVHTILERFRSGITRSVLVLPTGTGKTVTFGHLARELGVRTLVLAHRSELLAQAKDKIGLVWPEATVGIVKAEVDDVDAQVVIASVQTAFRTQRLQSLKEQNFGLLIIDECHHAPADSYRRIVKELGFFADDPGKLLVGCTATPTRSDGEGLDSVFQEIAYSMSIRTAIRAGYLASPIGRQVLTKTDLRGVSMLGGDFVTSELSAVVNTPSRNRMIVEAFQKHSADRKMALIFTVDVQHASDLSQAFNDAGIDSKAVYGAMSDEERERTLKDFSSGKYRVLCNCMLLVEGYDETAVDTIIMARPTQSEALFVQSIGRGLRLHPGKQDCLILDVTDNCQKHSLCNIRNSLEGAVKVISEFDEAQSEPELELPESPPEPVSYGGAKEFEFFDRLDFAWVLIGDDWLLSLSPDQKVLVKKDGDGYEIMVTEREKSTSLSKQSLPLSYAIGVAEDWARQQPKQGWARKDASWRAEPATPKQLDTLIRFGFQFDSSISKGEAAAILDAKFSEPATVRQIGWLRSKGVEFPRSITKNQARKLIAERLGKINGR